MHVWVWERGLGWTYQIGSLGQLDGLQLWKTNGVEDRSGLAEDTQKEWAVRQEENREWGPLGSQVKKVIRGWGSDQLYLMRNADRISKMNWENTFLFFKPPSRWYLVTAALASEYGGPQRVSFFLRMPIRATATCLYHICCKEFFLVCALMSTFENISLLWGALWGSFCGALLGGFLWSLFVKI